MVMVGFTNASAQKYFTKDGDVSFFSATPMENIEAHNKKATSVLDAATGNVEFAVLIKAFEFEKSLMQEHFNENYMESSKFPKAVFKGQIVNNADVNYKKDGVYKIKTKGQLTMHGVTKDIETNGTMEVKGGKITGISTFMVSPQDYNIEIPKLVREKIAKEIKVEVKSAFQPMNK
ncbi:MAG: YceI family protein [Sphingobacteriales bacterium]|nr:MAG: YceI family protein [Sphingobacteriales bacterium]